MTDCKYCGKPFKATPFNLEGHKVCLDQLSERLNELLCTRCGKHLITRHALWCNNCDDTSEFRDYAGPV